MAKETSTFKYPSLLSFKASIIPSIFSFYSFKEPETEENKEPFSFEKDNIFSYLTPIQVERSVLRTTIANFGEGEKIQSSLNDKGGANVQTIEKATLPPDSDTLVIRGSVKFFNNSGTPEAFNEASFKPVFDKYVELFKAKIGYKLLAERYFMNLINGQILWRNKYGEVNTKISIKGTKFSEVFSFNDLDFENNLSLDSITNVEKKQKASEFVQHIENALSGEDYLVLDIVAKITLGHGQTVYPSQEFDEAKKISKVLAKSIYEYKGNTISQAVFHEQKIGNAIRTIDTWYQDNAEVALAIEPYGISQKETKAYRVNNADKNDFYSYFMKLEQLVQELESVNFDINNSKVLHKHLFVMACLIRGGVYSGGKKSKDTETAGE